jgi:hypothetical protein
VFAVNKQMAKPVWRSWDDRNTKTVNGRDPSDLILASGDVGICIGAIICSERSLVQP